MSNKILHVNVLIQSAFYFSHELYNLENSMPISYSYITKKKKKLNYRN